MYKFKRLWRILEEYQKTGNQGNCLDSFVEHECTWHYYIDSVDRLLFDKCVNKHIDSVNNLGKCSMPKDSRLVNSCKY